MERFQIHFMSQGHHVFYMESLEVGRPIMCEKRQAMLGTLALQDSFP